MKRGGGLVGAWAAAGLVCLAAACSRAPDHPDRQSPISKDTDVGPVSGQPAVVGSPASASPPPATDADQTFTIHGWLSIVWNGQAHTFITDDEGDTRELLLDEDLTAPLGGPLALDRKRVAATAVAVQDRPEILRVLSIAREAGE